MTAISIHLQPDRSPKLDVDETVARLRALAETAHIDEGDDHGRYINIGFESNDPRALWELIQVQLRADLHLRHAAIVVCEGKHGWDDYLLLHHYDTTLTLDKLQA